MKNGAWRSLFNVAAITAFALISGCATPDFKPFATETAALGGAIAAEQAEVASHFAQAKGKAEARNPRDSRVSKLDEERTRYEANATALNQVVDLAVSYSNALVELAGAGETGPQAVDSLAATFSGFSSALSIASPVVALPAWAISLAKEVAQAATRIQAQKGLAEAAQTADPSIKRIAILISDLFSWPNGEQAAIATGLQSTEEGVLRDTIGKNRIAFYRGINVEEVKIGQRPAQTRLEYFFGDVDDQIAKQSPAAGICGITSQKPDSEPNCLTGQTVQSLESVVNLLSGIEPQFQAYTRDLAISRKWLEQRRAASGPISAAANAWAAEHEKLAEKLHECGGLHALRKSCGNITFANFKLSVERVKAIAGKGGQ